MLLLPVLLLISAGIIASQKRLTSLRQESWLVERMSYLPRTEDVRPFLLGFSSTFANYLWIRTMLYFGSHYLTDSEYPWLVTMVDMVTRLNPCFYPAYEFGGIMLPTHAGNVDAARIILNRGITHLGDRKWNIAFYLGWLHYDKYRDRLRAATYLALAAHTPDAPPLAARLAATMYHKADHTELAIEFLRSIEISSESPTVRRSVREKIASLEAER